MSVCHFLMNEMDKSIDKASKSLELNPTIKGYYRRAQAYSKKLNYDEAVKDLYSAIKLDTNDPNDLQTELVRFKNRAKKQEQDRLAKMSGFLLKPESKEGEKTAVASCDYTEDAQMEEKKVEEVAPE